LPISPKQQPSANLHVSTLFDSELEPHIEDEVQLIKPFMCQETGPVCYKGKLAHDQTVKPNITGMFIIHQQVLCYTTKRSV